MTKRFENVEIDKRYCLICLNDNIRFRSLSEEGLEDLLNELNDENEQLKSENIDLKVRLDICKKPLFSKRQLHQENQHIKHTIKTMMENERTEIGKNTLKQLWEAIQ